MKLLFILGAILQLVADFQQVKESHMMMEFLQEHLHIVLLIICVGNTRPPHNSFGSWMPTRAMYRLKFSDYSK